MSLFSNIGKAITKGIKDVTREVARSPVTSLIPGGGIVRTLAGGVASALTPRPAAAPTAINFASLPTGPAPISPPNNLAAGVAGPLGGVISAIGGGIVSTIGTGIINTLTPGSSSSANGKGCGCRSTGRDPCTGQRLSSQRAQTATFFGGCCPPGMTLRRISGGRDICIKTARMNVFNPAALARADRRVTGFARRAAPILHDMGYDVSRKRSVKLKTTRRKARR